jgi:hypothetical protein
MDICFVTLESFHLSHTYTHSQLSCGFSIVCPLSMPICSSAFTSYPTSLHSPHLPCFPHSSPRLTLHYLPAVIQLVPFGRSGGHGQVTSPWLGTFMAPNALVWVAKGRDLFVDFMFLARFKGWKKFRLPSNPGMF